MNETRHPDDVPAATILQLGDPGLRRTASRVEDLDDPAFAAAHDRLHATLRAFRGEHGFGRAIAAPQIGTALRFVAADLGEGTLTLVNPEITWRSDETMTLWDDCLSFPSLLVRVRRSTSITVRYTDERGATRQMTRLDPATSELFQHELDHLDGVLAVDRALDRDALVTREAFAAQPDHFMALVDHQGAPPRPGGEPGRPDWT